MIKTKKEALLKNTEVVEEINRHRWIESEKARTEISFEAAAEDWLKCYADGWVAHHQPTTIKAPAKRTVKKIAKK